MSLMNSIEVDWHADTIFVVVGLLYYTPTPYNTNIKFEEIPETRQL